MAEPRFFGEEGDRLVAVMLNMASEMWAHEERLMALEEARDGEARDRDARLRAFLDRLFAPLREPEQDA